VNPTLANVVFYAANVLYTGAFLALVFWPRSVFVTRRWVPLIHPLLMAIPYIVLAGPHLATGNLDYFSLEGVARLLSNSDIRLATWLDLMAVVPVVFSFIVRDLAAREASRTKIAVIALLGSAAAPLGLACFAVDKWLHLRRARTNPDL
jgi:hypothetical protein